MEREGRIANRGRGEPRPYSTPGWVTADRRRGWNLCPPAAGNITGKASAFKCDCGAIPSRTPGSCAAQAVTVIKGVIQRPTRQQSCTDSGPTRQLSCTDGDEPVTTGQGMGCFMVMTSIRKFKCEIFAESNVKMRTKEISEKLQSQRLQ